MSGEPIAEGSSPAGSCALVRRELPADLDTPVTAYLKLRPVGARFLLESVEQGERVGRYSFLGVGALREVVVSGRTATISRAAGRTTVDIEGKDPLALVRQLLLAAVPAEAEHANDPARSVGSSILLGAAVGFVGFDYARHIETLPDPGADPLGFPQVAFVVPEAVVAFDHLRRTLAVAALSEGSVEQARERTEEILARLRGPCPPAGAGRSAAPHFEGNHDAASFGAMVRAAKERIFAGDVFQVVLSHRLDARTAVDAFELYRVLRMRNPSPYSFYLEFDQFRIAGTSPEVLCRLEGRRATVRPIAGTRGRGADAASDEELAQELLADPKEAAEHAMLVDLGRNDLSRVCEPGTVRVDESRRLERFSHVMHLVSYVSGRLAESQDAASLFRAAFPAGTVSGAPKIRALEIIARLEGESRGPYAGAVGYFSPAGDTDFAIAIRTAFFAGDRLRLQAGAGIVADSDPGREWEETREKLAALLSAAGAAAEGLG